MTKLKSGSPFVYDDATDDIVGIRDADGGEKSLVTMGTTGLAIGGSEPTQAQRAQMRDSLSGGSSMNALRTMLLSRMPVSWDLMVGAPTITLGVANAASAISGAVNIAKDSALILESTRCETGAAFPSTLFRLPVNYDAQASGVAAAFTAATVASWTIITDAVQVEFKIMGQGFSSNGRIWVTENGVRKMAGIVPAVPSNGSSYWVLVEFSASGMREIEVELSGGKFGGWNISSSAVIGKKEQVGPSVMILGDSFSEGSGSTAGYHDGWAARFLRIIGATKKTVSAIGSTGYLANNNGLKKSLLERYEHDVVGLPHDVIIHTNGLNVTAVDHTAAASEVFAGINAGIPGCLQIAFGPFQPHSLDVEARRVAIATAAAENGVLFIDNVTDMEITGTGRLGAPAGNGNSDIVINPDNTHPTPYGHQHIAEWRFRALCKALSL